MEMKNTSDWKFDNLGLSISLQIKHPKDTFTSDPPETDSPLQRLSRLERPCRSCLFLTIIRSELWQGDHSKPVENLPLSPCCNSTETKSHCLKEDRLSLFGEYKSYCCIECGTPLLFDCGTTCNSTRPTYATQHKILHDPIKSTDSPFLSALSGLSSQDRFPLVGGAYYPQDVCINIGSSPNVKRDGTTTIDPKAYLWGKVTKAIFLESLCSTMTRARPFELSFYSLTRHLRLRTLTCAPEVMSHFCKHINRLCRLAQVEKALLGIPASDGYTNLSSQSQLPFIGEISSTWDVCIDIDSGPNMKRIDTITQSTNRWVKLAPLVLGISASAGCSSSSNFPKAANAAGFLASLTAISLHHAGKAATRILAKFGAIACAAGTLAVIGKDLPEEYTWIASVAFLIPATAVAFA